MAKFYGIGIGPGDKELLTLKAVRILSALDVLILPEAQMRAGSIAYDIAKDYIGPKVETIYIEFPMVTDMNQIEQAGKNAAKVVQDCVAKGQNVGFITLGDPSVYSTYGYILRSLAPEIQVETIPGITSFCASAALINKPLVERDEILSIIPATAEQEKIEKAMESSGGLVFMKVYNHSEKIVTLLEKQQLLQDSVLIKRCGMPDCTISKDVKGGLSEGKQYLSIILSRKGNK